MCVLHDYVVNKQHLATCLFLQSPFLLFWVSWLSFVFSRFFEMLSFFLKILHKYKNNFGHVIPPHNDFAPQISPHHFSLLLSDVLFEYFSVHETCSCGYSLQLHYSHVTRADSSRKTQKNENPASKSENL